MDINQISLIVVPPLCAGIGYMLKIIFDKRTEYISTLNNTKLKTIEFKLKNFYFPIYTNLLIENAIWGRFINFYKSDEAPANAAQIMVELDKEVLYIHLDNKHIIKNYLVEINPSQELLDLLIQYEEHVTIFSILRKVDTTATHPDDLMFPANFECYYPQGLLECIKTHLDILRAEQQEINNYTLLKEEKIKKSQFTNFYKSTSILNSNSNDSLNKSKYNFSDDISLSTPRGTPNFSSHPQLKQPDRVTQNNLEIILYDDKV